MALNDYLSFECSIRGMGKLYVTKTPTPCTLRARVFEEHGLRKISSEELAYARLRSYHDSNIFQQRSCVTEELLHIPSKLAGKATFILLKEPVGFDKIRVHPNGRIMNPSWISKEEANSILEEARKGSEKYHILENTEALPHENESEYLAIRRKKFPICDFGKDPTMQFLFGKSAKMYGEALESFPTMREKGVIMYLTSEAMVNQRSPYLEELCQSGFDGRFDFSGMQAYGPFSGMRTLGLISFVEAKRTKQEEALQKNALEAIKAGKPFEYHGKKYTLADDVNVKRD